MRALLIGARVKVLTRAATGMPSKRLPRGGPGKEREILVEARREADGQTLLSLTRSDPLDSCASECPQGGFYVNGTGGAPTRTTLSRGGGRRAGTGCGGALSITVGCGRDVWVADHESQQEINIYASCDSREKAACDSKAGRRALLASF